ncbi:TonB-dependent siderophore receptor [Acidovorax sp. SUPP3334]|uniref:TonB-dependent siderophore receptor n=1 Tax=Acidovorax sp. SUPP3334 TaxID=2920881 RepID=UPI0023DE4134|nr:TonB-dependent siderophore receptor [Acidovorax sp. SUPP3334]GKT25650.1 TonB-dependent siderophore receptor [Acidovorax sp. SUPP3334]
MPAFPRQTLLGAALAAAFGTLLAGASPVARAQTAPAVASQAFDVKIAAQPLGSALAELSRQTGVPVFAAGDLMAGTESRPVSGRLTVEQALQSMLAGSALEAGSAAGGGFAIRRASRQAASGTLSTVVVKAGADTERPDGPVVGYVAQRSRTATKTDTALLETPQSISVIGRTEMDARGSLDLMDIVAQTPGVSVAAYGPDNRGWEYISLRGFPGNTSSYRDGLPQTQFGVVYRMTEPYGLERVEVLRGPASVLFGQGDAGGVINRVSKAPSADATREIEVQVGSFDRRQLAFDVGGAFSEGSDLSFRLVGVGLDSNDQDRYPNGDRINRTHAYLAPSLRWQPSAATSFTLLGEFLKDKSGEDPYYANFFGPDGKLRHVKYGDPSFSRFQQDQSSLGYQFEHTLNSGWTVRQNARYTDIALERNALWADSVLADGHTISRSTRTWDDGLKQGSIDTQVQGKISTGTVEHTLLFGLDWNRIEGTALRFRGAGPNLDLLNPVYGMAVPAPTTPMANFTQKMDQIGLYAQDQIRFGERWVATLGGRQDHVKTTTDNRLSAPQRTTQSDDAFSGRIGVNYLLGGGWSPYASYAESFLPTSGVDLNNNPFKPSRGKQVEVGIKYQPEGGKSLFTAAVFDLRKTNVVTYDNITSDPRQIGKQRSRGLELEAKAELMRGLSATASFTVLNLKVLESADSSERGKIPPTVPKQTASLWLDYAIGGGFGVGAGVNYVGERQNDEANTSAEGGFTLLNASLRYDQGPWRFGLNATNLLDRKYNTICYHRECYMGRERTLTATAKYRW